MAKKTQAEKVIDYLKTHESFDQFECIKQFGFWKLSTRVSEINKKGEYRITSRLKQVTLGDGTKKIVAEYSLAQNIQPQSEVN